MTEEAWNAWGEDHHLKRASALIDQALSTTDVKDLDLKAALIQRALDQIIRHQKEAE